VIAPFAKSKKLADGKHHEPVYSCQYAEQIKIKAQVFWEFTEDVINDGNSLRISRSGYLIVRRIDISLKNYTPSRNDKILKVNDDNYDDIYIVSVRNKGHYSNYSGLIRLDFADRNPA
jgi:hypothetical protein